MSRPYRLRLCARRGVRLRHARSLPRWLYGRRFPSVLCPNAYPKYALYFGDLHLRGERRDRRAPDAPHGFPSARAAYGAPTLHDGVLYVPVASLEEGGLEPTYECCTFRGSVIAYDASTGTQISWEQLILSPEPNRPTRKTSVGTPSLGPAGAAAWSVLTIDPAWAACTLRRATPTRRLPPRPPTRLSPWTSRRADTTTPNDAYLTGPAHTWPVNTAW